MLISDCSYRDEILSEAAKELRRFEIKIRGEKQKFNIIEQNLNKRRSKKIFKIPLSHQNIDHALFSNGQCSSVPHFVLQACQKIQRESKTEGIFRKTGSVKKQNEIKSFLEQGGSLNERNFNVIDVANLLKTYFRELPEPLIPPGNMQDSLIKCLIFSSKYEERVDAILLTCLFLPSITVNTLAYFLQFLQVIIKNASENYMTLENLVKVLTPTIMPMPLNAPEKRLQSHFKIVELLIENANLIGVIPDRMIKRDDVLNVPMTEERKKKKRRSGSLNRVLNNFRKKIVGSLGSSESLDKSHENTIEDVTMMTPNVSKSAKKRRLEKLDLSAFGSRKKKDVLKLTALPEVDDIAVSPYAPKKTEPKRCSLGEKLVKNASPKVRRHSLAPNTLTRNKYVVPLQEKLSDNNIVDTVDSCKEDEYVRVPKKEYDEFKTRLNSIESKITKEFNDVKLITIKAEYAKKDNSRTLNGPEKVENKFHETLQEVEKIEDSERKTEQLAKRLSRELKIRPAIENPVIRSPSARKIGSLRRRAISRNQSWHLGPSALSKTAKDETLENKTLTSSLNFYPKPALKRARLVDSLLVNQDVNPLPAIPQSTEKVIPEKPVRKTVNNTNSLHAAEVWTSATDFFSDSKNVPSSIENEALKGMQMDTTFKTPTRPTRKFAAASDIDLNNTPMLPPKMTPARHRQTPMSDMKSTPINKSLLLTPGETRDGQARASIIQIRNQNAGMVAKNAKIFEHLSADVHKSADRSIRIPRVVVNKKLENVKNMSVDLPPQKKTPQPSPRRSSRSPRVNRRMQLRLSSQSPLLKTIKENTENRPELLKPDVLNEIASPKNRKAVLSQNNTPRGRSKTPRSSSKKKHRRATRSPMFRRQHISFD